MKQREYMQKLPSFLKEWCPKGGVVFINSLKANSYTNHPVCSLRSQPPLLSRRGVFYRFHSCGATLICTTIEFQIRPYLGN